MGSRRGRRLIRVYRATCNDLLYKYRKGGGGAAGEVLSGWDRRGQHEGGSALSGLRAAVRSGDDGIRPSGEQDHPGEGDGQALRPHLNALRSLFQAILALVSGSAPIPRRGLYRTYRLRRRDRGGHLPDLLFQLSLPVQLHGRRMAYEDGSAMHRSRRDGRGVNGMRSSAEATMVVYRVAR